MSDDYLSKPFSIGSEGVPGKLEITFNYTIIDFLAKKS